MLDGAKARSFDVLLALLSAASKDYGKSTPFAGAFDVFIRIYESFEDRTQPKARSALYGVFHTGGVDYVRALFEASEQPPPCTPYCGAVVRREGEWPPANPCRPNYSTWCEAGALLMRNTDEGPDPAVWEPLCYQQRY